MSTLITAFGLILLLVVSNVVGIRLVASWLKIPRATWLAVTGAVLLVAISNGVIMIAVNWIGGDLPPRNGGETVLMVCLRLVPSVAITLFVLRKAFHISLKQAGILWGTSLLIGIGAIVISTYLTKPYVLESFLTPVNSMAPSLLGWHRTAECSHCGGTLVVLGDPPKPPQPPKPAFLSQGSHDQPEDTSAICEHCWTQFPESKPSPGILPRDRFLVDRRIVPQRWDMVLFQSPEEQTGEYVKRLVGLPGEKVYLKKGTIWVNDIRQDPPASIANLRYVTAGEDFESLRMGTEARPWLLGNDEYVVLGDFSNRSRDSRVYGPVPRQNIRGVVTVIYWPLSRRKILR